MPLWFMLRPNIHIGRDCTKRHLSVVSRIAQLHSATARSDLGVFVCSFGIGCDKDLPEATKPYFFVGSDYKP